MKKVNNLSWADRLALLDHYQPSDAVACSALQVSNDELQTARDLQHIGSVVATTDINVDSYASLFQDGSSVVRAVSNKSNLESVVRASGKGQPPLTATKRVSPPKKRGRKGNNIATAFQAIPTQPVDVTVFAQTHGVSLAVLRQSKRFDTVEGGGVVTVRKDKDSGTLMIWRNEVTA